MSKDTLVGGYVCYNNDAFYVVNINTSPGMQPFEALPGGNHQTLNGNDWGGVILEDMVQSSYQAYQLNGNANGYEMPALSKIIDGSGTEGDLVFENGIRTPGFFTLPICDDIEAASNTVEGGDAKGKYWPCDAPAGYNAGGTNVVRIQQKEEHLVWRFLLTWNHEARQQRMYQCEWWEYLQVSNQVHQYVSTILKFSFCVDRYTHKTIDIADQSTGDITATIYAQFNGDDKTDYKVTPGCKLEASWPRAYGDVYFGANNCLYDSTGTNINGQCCTETTTDSVLNPYYGY